jgi:hypothetical protein
MKILILLSAVAMLIGLAIIVDRARIYLQDTQDPAFAERQKQKAEVKQLQIGDRLRVSDKTGEDTCTVTRVDKNGETFDVSWDEGTGRKTQWYFDIGLFERLPRE